MTDSKPASLGERMASLAREHLALSVSAALVAVSVLHIALVARFDPQTVRAMLAVSDRTEVLLSTLTIVFVGLFAVGLIMFWRQLLPLYLKAVDQSFSRQLLAVFVIGVFAVGAVRLPVMFWLAVGFATLYTYLARRRAKKAGTLLDDGRVELSVESYSWLTLSFAISLSALAIVYLSEPWVARENVELAKSKDVSGYVMGTDGRFTAMLVDHEVRWVLTSDILGRELCDAGSDGWLSKRLRFGVNYPKCDD